MESGRWGPMGGGLTASFSAKGRGRPRSKSLRPSFNFSAPTATSSFKAPAEPQSTLNLPPSGRRNRRVSIAPPGGRMGGPPSIADDASKGPMGMQSMTFKMGGRGTASFGPMGPRNATSSMHMRSGRQQPRARPRRRSRSDLTVGSQGPSSRGSEVGDEVHGSFSISTEVPARKMSTSSAYGAAAPPVVRVPAQSARAVSSVPPKTKSKAPRRGEKKSQASPFSWFDPSSAPMAPDSSAGWMPSPHHGSVPPSEVAAAAAAAAATAAAGARSMAGGMLLAAPTSPSAAVTRGGHSLAALTSGRLAGCGAETLPFPWSLSSQAIHAVAASPNKRREPVSRLDPSEPHSSVRASQLAALTSASSQSPRRQTAGLRVSWNLTALPQPGSVGAPSGALSGAGEVAVGTVISHALAARDLLTAKRVAAAFHHGAIAATVPSTGGRSLESSHRLFEADVDDATAGVRAKLRKPFRAALAQRWLLAYCAGFVLSTDVEEVMELGAGRGPPTFGTADRWRWLLDIAPWAASFPPPTSEARAPWDDAAVEVAAAAPCEHDGHPARTLWRQSSGWYVVDSPRSLGTEEEEHLRPTADQVRGHCEVVRYLLSIGAVVDGMPLWTGEQAVQGGGSAAHSGSVAGAVAPSPSRNHLPPLATPTPNRRSSRSPMSPPGTPQPPLGVASTPEVHTPSLVDMGVSSSCTSSAARGALPGWAIPLHVAAAVGRVGAVRALLACGARVDGQCSFRETSLVQAVRRGTAAGAVATTVTLLESGANICAPDRDGREPLAMVMVARVPSLLRALLRRGAAAKAVPRPLEVQLCENVHRGALNSALSFCVPRVVEKLEHTATPVYTSPWHGVNPNAPYPLAAPAAAAHAGTSIFFSLLAIAGPSISSHDSCVFLEALETSGHVAPHDAAAAAGDAAAAATAAAVAPLGFEDPTSPPVVPGRGARGGGVGDSSVGPRRRSFGAQDGQSGGRGRKVEGRGGAPTASAVGASLAADASGALESTGGPRRGSVSNPVQSVLFQAALQSAEDSTLLHAFPQSLSLSSSSKGGRETLSIHSAALTHAASALARARLATWGVGGALASGLSPAFGIVAALLAGGAVVDAPQSGGATSVHLACTVSRPCAEVILAVSLSPGATDASGNSPLHYAISSGRLDIVELLVERPVCSINAHTECGTTPLHLAVSSQQPALVRLLLHAGADVGRGDSLGNTALHYALANAHVELATTLIHSQPILRIGRKMRATVRRLKNAAAADDEQTRARESPPQKSAFEVLAMEDDTLFGPMVKATRVKKRKKEGMQSMRAGGRGRRDAGSDRIVAAGDYNTDAFFEAGGGYTLTTSVQSDPGEEVDDAVAVGSETSQAGKESRTKAAGLKVDAPKSAAAAAAAAGLPSPSTAKPKVDTDGDADSVGSVDVELFDINASNDDGASYLHYATSVGLESLVRALLERGADPAQADQFGNVPLHYAASRGDSEACEAILDSVHAALDILDQLDDTSEAAREAAAMKGPLTSAAAAAAVATAVGASQPAELQLPQYIRSAARDAILCALTCANANGVAPFHFAASQAMSSLCARMFALGARARVRDTHGYIPLDYAKVASGENAADCVQLLEILTEADEAEHGPEDVIPQVTAPSAAAVASAKGGDGALVLSIPTMGDERGEGGEGEQPQPASDGVDQSSEEAAAATALRIGESMKTPRSPGWGALRASYRSITARRPSFLQAVLDATAAVEEPAPDAASSGDGESSSRKKSAKEKKSKKEKRKKEKKEKEKEKHHHHHKSRRRSSETGRGKDSVSSKKSVDKHGLGAPVTPVTPSTAIEFVTVGGTSVAPTALSMAPLTPVDHPPPPVAEAVQQGAEQTTGILDGIAQRASLAAAAAAATNVSLPVGVTGPAAAAAAAPTPAPAAQLAKKSKDSGGKARADADTSSAASGGSSRPSKGSKGLKGRKRRKKRSEGAAAKLSLSDMAKAASSAVEAAQKEDKNDTPPEVVSGVPPPAADSESGAPQGAELTMQSSKRRGPRTKPPAEPETSTLQPPTTEGGSAVSPSTPLSLAALAQHSSKASLHSKGKTGEWLKEMKL